MMFHLLFTKYPHLPCRVCFSVKYLITLKITLLTNMYSKTLRICWYMYHCVHKELCVSPVCYYVHVCSGILVFFSLCQKCGYWGWKSRYKSSESEQTCGLKSLRMRSFKVQWSQGELRIGIKIFWRLHYNVFLTLSLNINDITWCFE